MSFSLAIPCQRQEEQYRTAQVLRWRTTALEKLSFTAGCVEDPVSQEKLHRKGPPQLDAVLLLLHSMPNARFVRIVPVRTLQCEYGMACLHMSTLT